MGASGAGKSILIRCLAKVWPERWYDAGVNNVEQLNMVKFMSATPFVPIDHLNLKQWLLSQKFDSRANALF